MVAEEAAKLLQAARDGDLSSLDSDKVTDSLQDDLGATCVHYAARGGRVPVVEFLVTTKGLNPNKRSNVGATPLHDAAATGNLSVLKWLLAHANTKVDDQDGTGATVTHLSARYGHTQTLEWLLDETDCDVNKKSASGALPLHFAAEGGHLECVKLLVAEDPGSINMQMNNGCTAAYLACQMGYLPAAEFLALKRDGTLKIHTYDGMLPLHAAAQTGQLHIVKWLVKDQGLNPNERDFDGATPLHYAASRGHREVVVWLLKEGGARIILDNLGGSPLHSAAEFGQNKVILSLLQNGCSADITDNEGLTAEELAEKCGQTQSVALLRGELTSVPESPTRPDKETPQQKAAPPVSSKPPASAASSSRSAQPLVRQQSVLGREKQVFHAREADYYTRSQSIVSTASSASSFGYFSPNGGGKIETVSVDIHDSPVKTQQVCVFSSQETGEQERCPVTGKLLSHFYSQPTTTASSVSAFKATSQQQASSKGFITTINSQPSSTTSTLSSLSPRSASATHDSDSESERKVTQVNHVRQREPTAVTTERWGVTESGASRKPVKSPPVVASRARMDVGGSASNGGATLNGDASAGSKPAGGQGPAKSVIQISNKNVTIISTGKDSSAAPKITTTPLRKSDNDLPAKGSVSQRKKDTEFMSALSQKYQGNGTSTVVRPTSVPVTGRVVNSNPSDMGANSGAPEKGADSETRPVWKQQQLNAQITAALMRQQMPDASPPPPPPPPPVLVNGHAQSSTAEMNGHSSSGQSSPGLVPPPPPAPPAPASNGLKADASYNSTRPKTLSTQSSGSSSPRGYGVTPEKQKHDLMAALHAVVNSGAPAAQLKKTRGPHQGGVREVFSSKRTSGTSTPTMDKQQAGTTPLPPSDEFDPRNFLDKVQETDSSGNKIPDWKRHMMAKTMAQKAHADYIERKKVEDYEARFTNMPAWKRALIEKKEGTAK